MARGKIAEMVEDEATRAEAENPDEDEAEPVAEPDPDEDEDEDEAEPVAEPVEPAEPLSMEERAAAIEAVVTLHFSSLEMVFGDDWQNANNCPLCSGLGAVFPEDVPLDPTTQKCGRCKGWGVLMTEAVNENNITRQCPDCMGNGYVPRVEAVPTSSNFEGNAANGQPQTFTVPPMPSYDPAANVWRDPQGNALVGVTP